MGFVDIAALIIGLSPDGGFLFDTQWGGKNGDTAAGVTVAPNGSVYIAGQSGSFGAGLGDAFVLHLLPTGKSADAVTWGGTGLDAGAGVGLAADGTLSLAATAASPPYSFLTAPRKTTMVRSTMAVPAGTLATPAGTVADPAAPVIISNGVTTFGGSADAALVRIRPAP